MKLSTYSSYPSRPHQSSKSRLCRLTIFRKAPKPTLPVLSIPTPPLYSNQPESSSSITTALLDSRGHFKRPFKTHALSLSSVTYPTTEGYLRELGFEHDRNPAAMKMKESEDYLTVKFPNPWTGVLSPYIENEDDRRKGENENGYIEINTSPSKNTRPHMRRHTLPHQKRPTPAIIQRKPLPSSTNPTSPTANNTTSLLGRIYATLLTSLLAMTTHIHHVLTSASLTTGDWGLAAVYVVVLAYLVFLGFWFLVFGVEVGRVVLGPFWMLGELLGRGLG